MVQIDIPMAFGLGSFFAGAARKQIQAGDTTATWNALARSLVFQCLFVFWLPLYLLVSYFGFQTTHMWWHGDSLADYPLLLPGFFVLYFVSHLLGFAFGVKLVRQGNASWTTGIFVAAWVVFIGWVAVQPKRSLTVGTYSEYKAGTAVWAWQDPFILPVIGFAIVVFFVALYFFHRSLRQA